MGTLHTLLPVAAAFAKYDKKYAISNRRCVTPSFNEIRHILNLAQVMAIGSKVKLMTFDGDQTLYSDGGNFENSRELAGAMLDLMRAGVYVSVVTAAGYGLDGSKYEVRLDGMLRAIESAGLDAETAQRLIVMGGECNYLLRVQLTQEGKAKLVPVASEEWQGDHLDGPKPLHWPEEDTKFMMDLAQNSMTASATDLRLRCKIIRKARSVGMIPGGDAMVATVPVGHGSKKLKREALDEVVLRVMETFREQGSRISLPWCAFNGGRDAWVDVGDKSVGVAALQTWLGVEPSETIHVGDQFLNVGNDIKARERCPCLWITSPRETEKMLVHVLEYAGIEGEFRYAQEDPLGAGVGPTAAPTVVMDAFTGEMKTI